MMDYSFIIPVYNCKDFLPDCVASICAVGAASWEIILVDDGSTDGSGEVCDRLAEQYPEVRVIHQENSGVSAARNRGIREARGESVLFLDADDSIESQLLGQILEDPRCRESDMVIYGLTFDYYRNGSCYRRDPLFFEQDGILGRQGWTGAFWELFIRNSLSPVWNKVYKRSILQEKSLKLDTGMFLYEDFEFVLRYMQHCNTIWNVPQAIYHYRQPEDEGNAKRRLARIDRLSEFLKPIEAALEGLSDVPAEQRQMILVQLHQVLARQKISGSNLAHIRGICEDYARWYQSGGFTVCQDRFHQRLTNGKMLTLWMQDKKAALRHAVAVRVKSLLHRMR